MRQLAIVKYSGQNSEPERTITLPIGHLKALQGMIPRCLQEELLAEDISLPDLLSELETMSVDGPVMTLENHRKGQRIELLIRSNGAVQDAPGN